MKYLIAGLLILALIAALCAFSLSYEDRHLGGVLSLLEQAAKAEDSAAALSLTEEAHRRWKEDASEFTLLLTLEDVGELDRVFDNALRALRRGAESGPDLLDDLCSLVGVMLRRDRFAWENIL